MSHQETADGQLLTGNKQASVARRSSGFHSAEDQVDNLNAADTAQTADSYP